MFKSLERGRLTLIGAFHSRRQGTATGLSRLSQDRGPSCSQQRSVTHSHLVVPTFRESASVPGAQAQPRVTRTWHLPQRSSGG